MTEEKQTESTTSTKLSRRSMLKWTAGLAVAGAVGVGVGYGGSELLRPVPPEEPATAALPEEKIYATLTNNGPRLTYVSGGRVIRTSTIPTPPGARFHRFKVGDKTFTPPSKSINGPVAFGYRDYTYASERIMYPMKRVGFTPGPQTADSVANRGKGEFVRITWDEATDIVASEIKRMWEVYGQGAINYYSGSNTEQTSFEGTGAHDRVLNILGGYTRTREPTYSEPGWAYGASFVHGFYWQKGAADQDDIILDVLTNSEMVIFWGTNPLITTQTGDGAFAANLYFYLKELGKKVVVVGPRYNDTAIKFADTWIPIIPGTDCAMMAAIAYVWIAEGTYDKEYVATHSIGFDDQSLPAGAPPNSSFTAYVTGAMDGVPKTPEWAEKITGVKARVITALAREWASKPTMLACGHGGPNRNSYAHEWTRYCIALLTMQGYGKPGVNYWDYCEGWPGNQLSAPNVGLSSALKSYSNKVRQTLLRFVFTDAILNHTATWNSDELSASPENAFKTFKYPTEGYSEIKMQYCAGHSNFSARVDANKTAKAYMSPNLEFIVTASPWWGGSCIYSDVVLPLSTLLEQEDIGDGGNIHNFIVYHGKAVDPLGESKPDFEAGLALAKKLGIEDKYAEGKSKDEMFRTAFGKSAIADLMSYEEFKKAGYVYNPSSYDKKYKPEVSQRWFYELKGEEIKPDNGFSTPSGKIEFFSQWIFKYRGTDDPVIAPVPKYYPVFGREDIDSEAAKKHPLRLLTSHRLFRFHGQYDCVTMLKECYKVEDKDGYWHEPVYISPADANARGIQNGDIVRVFNDRGAVLAGATITKTMLPGVVQIHQGSWYDPVNPREPYLDKSGCANVLTHTKGQSEFGRCVPDVTAFVEVEKWTGST